MDRNSAEVVWTDEQWQRVLSAVSDEASKAKVAGSFLPKDGPYDATTIAVPNLRLNNQTVPAPEGAQQVVGGPERVIVSTDPDLYILRIAVNVYLRQADLADPELKSAMGAFRRAANIISRTEDAIVFRGGGFGNALAANVANVVRVGGPAAAAVGIFENPIVAPPINRAFVQLGAAPGTALVAGVASAITLLENAGNVGPFACVLGDNLFAESNNPIATFVMPRDRIMPYVDGRLYRSSAVPSIPAVANDWGAVLALGGAPLEIVMASDVGVKFIQINTEPRYVFRVQERIAFRPKSLDAICLLYR